MVRDVLPRSLDCPSRSSQDAALAKPPMISTDSFLNVHHKKSPSNSMTTGGREARSLSFNEGFRRSSDVGEQTEDTQSIPSPHEPALETSVGERASALEAARQQRLAEREVHGTRDGRSPRDELGTRASQFRDESQPANSAHTPSAAEPATGADDHQTATAAPAAEPPAAEAAAAVEAALQFAPLSPSFSSSLSSALPSSSSSAAGALAGTQRLPKAGSSASVATTRAAVLHRLAAEPLNSPLAFLGVVLAVQFAMIVLAS